MLPYLLLEYLVSMQILSMSPLTMVVQGFYDLRRNQWGCVQWVSNNSAKSWESSKLQDLTDGSCLHHVHARLHFKVFINKYTLIKQRLTERKQGRSNMKFVCFIQETYHSTRYDAAIISCEETMSQISGCALRFVLTIEKAYSWCFND